MSSSKMKATFAKRVGGRIAHISEVARGLKCECRCLHCDAQMIARKGDIKAHHFAHYGPDCGGGMTWLHRTAQQILVQERTIHLAANRYGSEGGRLEFREVRTEALVGGRRIDALGITVDGNELAIEIRVTHEVDDSKLRDLREANIAAVEVDLRELTSMMPDWGTLRNAICESPEYIKWLHDPLAHEKELNAVAAYRTHLRDLIQQYGIGTFSEHYGVGATECWRCGTTIPVFEWPEDHAEGGLDRIPDEGDVPPVPRPRTIAWSYSKTEEAAYWGNHCPKCNSLQGQFLLFDNMLDYLEEWLGKHGKGVGLWDLGEYLNPSLFMFDL